MGTEKIPTLLIVDDEELLRQAIAMDFKRKGYHVLEAQNGRQAIEVIKSHCVDAVISDIRMPGGDGVELLDSIKSMDTNLPVVLLITGFADISDEEAYDRGADAIFSKPFDRKALAAAVQKALETKRLMLEARSNKRFIVNFDIKLNLSGVEVLGKVLNIGRGGVFVELKDNFPEMQSSCEFQMKFANGHVSHEVSGTGIVRWARDKQNGSLPLGCGIEFTSFKGPGRDEIISLLSNLDKKAYIPKS